MEEARTKHVPLQEDADQAGWTDSDIDNIGEVQGTGPFFAQKGYQDSHKLTQIIQLTNNTNCYSTERDSRDKLRADFPSYWSCSATRTLLGSVT